MDKIIDNNLFNKFIRLLYVATAIGAFTDIFDTSVVGGASTSIISSLKITTPEFGLLGSMTFVGGLFGAISFGFLSDKIGRKRSFILTLLLFIIFELLSGLAPNYDSLLVFRIIVGFAIGADYVPAITLLSEFVEPDKRGSSFDFFWIIANVGALVAYIIAFLLVPLGPYQWRVLFILGVIPPVIGLVLRTKLPETPRWLAVHNRIPEAERAVDEIGLSRDNLPKYEKYIEPESKLMKPYIWGVTVPLFLVMLLNIPASGLLELTPVLLLSLHIPKSNTLLFTAGAWVTPVIIGNIVAFKLMDILGRIKMIVIGAVGLGLALISMVIFSSHAHFNVPLMLISLAIGGFIQSFYIPVIYSLSTELYPTEIRGIGQGISVGGIRVAGIIGILGGALLLTYYKVPGMLLTYAAICFGATLVTVFWMGKKTETNKKELEDISARFEKD